MPVGNNQISHTVDSNSDTDYGHPCPVILVAIQTQNNTKPHDLMEIK